MDSLHALARRVVRSTPVGLVIGLVLALAVPAFGNVQLTVVSRDPFTNTDSYHATEVEPDTFAFGNTIVSTFQVGRFNDGGASSIGWATSNDAGRHWVRGFLPSLTIYSTPPGPYQRATDPAVAYDAEHDVWMVISLDSKASFGFTGNAVTVSRSTDGGRTFGAPVNVKTTNSTSFDSTWGSCDTWAASPNFGNCYIEWDDFGIGNTLMMSRSTDGGLTWTDSTTPGSVVIGGKPVALPNGRVVVPIDDGFTGSVQSFVSTNGGASYIPRTWAGCRSRSWSPRWRRRAVAPPRSRAPGSGCRAGSS